MGVIREFKNHIVPAVIQPLRVVWNQSIAFLFFVIAFLGGVMVYREYQKRTDLDAILSLALGGFFVTMMAGYGIHSLLRARRASRG